MIKIEKLMLRKFSEAQIVGLIHTDKLDKVLFTLSAAPEITIEAWVGKRVTFSAIVDGESVRLHPKTGVRYDNLEAWLRETAEGR